jgi:hypothetical protein
MPAAAERLRQIDDERRTLAADLHFLSLAGQQLLLRADDVDVGA